MDQQMHIKRPSPWDNTNYISKIFFLWVWPLFREGHKHDLNFEDLYRCPKRDAANLTGDKLEKEWKKELLKPKPIFIKAVFRAFALEFLPFLLVFVIQECVIRVSQPIFLGIVLRYFQDENSSITRAEACWSAFGIVASTMIVVTMNHITLAHVLRIGIRVRVACCTLLYRKSLKLSRNAMAQTTIGQIINIFSNDVNRFDDISLVLHSPVVFVLQSSVIMFMLWEYLQWACITGVAVLVLFVPFQAIMGKLFQATRKRTASLTDYRIRVMSEIISGMRVIKMYTWEIPFSRVVNDCRKKEVKRIRQASILKAINLSIYLMSSKLILFACFVTYVYLYGALKPDAVFVSISYFNILRLTVAKKLPASIEALAETFVTCRRIQNVLLLGEIDTGKANDEPKPEAKNISSVHIHNATAFWNLESPIPTFSDIDVQVKPGQLLVIIGPVGSGKSSLLMAMLKELPLESGSIQIDGQISYSSQEAWTFVATVRENILFGSEYDPERYKDVIRVCALEKDFEQFPNGDQTIIGERGTSLSGGQRTRITLARAIYRKSDVYLLDDPLSAVDAHVAKHIFQRCIMNYLGKQTRILVTHQLQYLQNADKIMILKDSKVFACGTFIELRDRGVNFSSFVQRKPQHDNQQRHRVGSFRSRSISWTPSINSIDSNHGLHPLGCFDEEQKKPEAETKKVEEPNWLQETKQTGSIKFSVYWTYIKASKSLFAVAIAFLSIILSQALLQYSDIWVTEWTNDQHNKDQIGNFEESKSFFVKIYILIICLMIVMTLIRTISFFTICMKTSVNLHNTIFTRLLMTPVSHFDQNPSGRILNRFSKDTGIVDEKLPSVSADLEYALSNIIAIVIVNSYTNYFLLIPGVILFVIVYFLRRFYIPAARDIKRLENIARSPVYSHISNTLTGLTTLRAFGVEKMFLDQFYKYQNIHSAAYFMSICTARGFGVMVDWVCACYIASVVLVSLFSGEVFASYAGLALSYSLTLIGITQWGMRCSADIESYMTSVERMVEYTHLEPEGAPSLNNSRQLVYRMPSQDKWPSEGEIKFQNVTMFYDGSAMPVLKNINCDIVGGTKVGVVGRTGAGKSSLIMALFRMCRRIEGVIKIDGIDTSELMLSHLRKNISIIPQEPLIFTGTVRYNLDPFSEHEDERLWQVLTEVELKLVIQLLPGQLDSQITEGGSNFSVGQRQLICLARAILRDNKILLLDEATANIDHRTDQLIQKTIRRRFAKCTVITVAHRLNTIIDSDKIIVLDSGVLVDYDTPYDLLRKQSGVFYSLVQETGKRMSKKLFQIAQDTYFGRMYVDDEDLAETEIYDTTDVNNNAHNTVH